MIGMVELFGAAYLSPHLRDVYVFTLLIVVLLSALRGCSARPPWRRSDGLTSGLRERAALRPGWGAVVLGAARAAGPGRRASALHAQFVVGPAAGPLLRQAAHGRGHRRAARGLAEPGQRLHGPVLDRPRGVHGGRRLRRGQPDLLRPVPAVREPAGWSGGFLGRPRRCSWSSLLAGGLAAAVAGLVVGLPSLRLRGDYLALVTLGFGEILRVLIQRTDDVLVRRRGRSRPPPGGTCPRHQRRRGARVQRHPVLHEPVLGVA
jgi:hypothetical protein